MQPGDALARIWNLLLPGVGLVLAGSVAMGWFVGLVFTALLNAVIAAALLFPDDVPSNVRGLLTGAVLGTYLAAQLRLAQALRTRRRNMAAERRRQAQSLAAEQLAAGDARLAVATLAALREEFPDDLLIAYRLAQAYSALGDPEAAAAAWLALRRLDRHRIYRDEIERNLEGVPPAIARSASGLDGASGTSQPRRGR